MELGISAMSLKAVLFDFNGVIIKDRPIHIQLMDEILLGENLQLQRVQERQAFFRGRPPRLPAKPTQRSWSFSDRILCDSITDTQSSRLYS